MHAQDPHALREPARLHHAHARVAERAEILGREKRQATDVADAARAPPVSERGTDRLSRVFDDREPMLARDCVERVHVGHLAVEVHRHQRLHDAASAAVHEPVADDLAFARERRGDRGRGEIERRRIDVAEERPCAEPRDDAGRREEGERRRDDLVARADVERHQRDEQRVGAGRDADSEGRLRVGRDLFFELRDVRSENEALRVADLADGRFDLGAQRRVLPFQIQQRDFHSATSHGVASRDRRDEARVARVARPWVASREIGEGRAANTQRLRKPPPTTDGTTHGSIKLRA